MILETTERAPIVLRGTRMTGMVYDKALDQDVPGKVLALWLEARKQCGVLKAKKKDGVKFKIRSAEEVVDKLRAIANNLGLLIYPSEAKGEGHVVEDGTLATVELTIVVQAVEDGSRLSIAGFGLGADNQDKAGGKAGTYAFKQALVQALLAGGAEDTDDTDTPIEGGVKPKTKAKGPTEDQVREAFDGVADQRAYKEAVALLMKLSPDKQLMVKDAVATAKARINGATKAP